MRTKGTSGFFYRESREEKSNKKKQRKKNQRRGQNAGAIGTIRHAILGTLSSWR
jgi:hypothetical protein